MPTQFPRTIDIPSQSPKYWVKEKNRYLRQLLIGDIETASGRPLFVYFSQLDQQINHTDPDDLSEILSGIDAEEADFFLQTPGGNVDATEKAYWNSETKTEVMAGNRSKLAKSAGTVIALSSSEIVLGLNSELGPIDPQFQAPGVNIPADILATDPSQPHHIRELAKLAVARMRQLAFDILQKGMMHGKTPQEINDVLDKISSASGYKSHGAVIDYEETQSLRLSSTYLAFDNDLWKKIWLLYCMYDYDTKQDGIGRIVEGSRFSIARPK